MKMHHTCCGLRPEGVRPEVYHFQISIWREGLHSLMLCQSMECPIIQHLISSIIMFKELAPHVPDLD